MRTTGVFTVRNNKRSSERIFRYNSSGRLEAVDTVAPWPMWELFPYQFVALGGSERRETLVNSLGPHERAS